MTRTCFVAVMLLATVACAQPKPGGLTTADSTALRALDSSFVSAILGSDWSALTTYYTQDAVLMPPNEPSVLGPTAISQWFANTGLQVNEFTINVSSLEGQPEMAGVRGTYTFTFTLAPATAAVTDSGKFLWLVRRGPDGRWRIAAEIWNSSVPLPLP